MNHFELSPEDLRRLKEYCEARTEEENVRYRAAFEARTGQEPKRPDSPAAPTRINPPAALLCSPPIKPRRGGSVMDWLGGLCFLGPIAVVIWVFLVGPRDDGKTKEVPLVSSEQVERGIQRAAEADKYFKEQFDQKRRQEDEREGWRRMSPEESERELFNRLMGSPDRSTRNAIRPGSF